jgi:ABC-type Co2+ transport system permease subunit
MVVSIVVIGYSLRRVNQDLNERQVPLMGVLAAAIFAGKCSILAFQAAHRYLMGAPSPQFF